MFPLHLVPVKIRCWWFTHTSNWWIQINLVNSNKTSNSFLTPISGVEHSTIFTAKCYISLPVFTMSAKMRSVVCRYPWNDGTLWPHYTAIIAMATTGLKYILLGIIWTYECGILRWCMEWPMIVDLSILHQNIPACGLISICISNQTYIWYGSLRKIIKDPGHVAIICHKNTINCWENNLLLKDVWLMIQQLK